MRRIALTALGSALVLAATAGVPAGATIAATQENVRLIGNVPGSTGGHSVVVGNRLYVGAYGMGMRIFDITNPRSPQVIGQYFPGPQSANDPGLRADAVPDGAIWDGRHIAALNGTNRAAATRQTEFLDVTDPANPILLHRFSGLPDGEAHNGDIARTRKLWIPSGGGAGEGLRIYDMSPLLETPPQPPVNLFRGNPHTLWVGSPYKEFTDAPAGSPFNHTHDVEIYEDLEILLPPWEWETDEAGTPIPTRGKKDILLLAGATGYAVDGPGANDGAAYIIDITDPANPEVINKWQNPAAGSDMIRYFHEAQFLHGDPSTMVVADEDLHSGCQGGRLYTVRVSENLMQAEKLAEWAIGAGQAGTPTCAGSHVFSSRGRHLFMGAYTAGLQVVDLRDPANPVRAGQYIPEGANYWGALYHEGVIYAGDFGARGLDVLEFIRDPVAKGLVKVNNPAALLAGGIAETLGECDPGSPVNESDGLIVPIPEDKRDGNATLRALGASDGPYDLNAYFYDASCAFMGGSSINDEGADAIGLIPEGAGAAVVVLITGPPTRVYAQIDPLPL